MSTINELAQKFNSDLDDIHLDYLLKRGLEEKTIKESLIGLGNVYGKTRITIPIFDSEKNVLFFKCRRSPLEIDSDVVKYIYYHPDSDGEKSAALYGIEQLRNTNAGETIAITEGELDALVLRQKGVVSLTSTGGCGTFQEEWAKILKDFSCVYICYDNDSPGKEGAVKVARLLRNQNIYIVDIPNNDSIKDVTDYFIKYPKHEFNDLKDLSKKFDKSLLEYSDLEIIDGRSEFIPAQFFIQDKAYITTKLYTREKDSEYTGLYVISSDRKISELEDFVKANNFYLSRSLDLENRWSKDVLVNFLKGKDIDVDITRTFGSVVNNLNYYLDLGNNSLYKATALWLIGTYFFKLFKAYPYYNIVGLMNSGKSKMLELCSLLAFNGELLMGSTPAFIIRSIHDNCASIFLDEAEKLKDTSSPESQTLILMLNSGYKSGVRIGKMNSSEKIKGWSQIRYDPYSPKMIAGINNISDTLISRSINITLIASTNKDIKNREIDSDSADFRDIRDELYLCIMKYHSLVKEVYSIVSEEAISGRNWEVWKPILTMACVVDLSRGDNNPTLYQEILDYAITKIKVASQISEESQTALQLLLALKQMMESDNIKESFYPTENIKEYLIKFHSDEFGWLKEVSGSKYLGPTLRKTGIVDGGSRVKWFDSKAMRGYDLNLDLICSRLDALGVTT